MKRIIASPAAPKAVGPYSQAVQCNGTLYISGQLPVDGATGAVAEGIEAQTRQSLTNIGHLLCVGAVLLCCRNPMTDLQKTLLQYHSHNDMRVSFTLPPKRVAGPRFAPKVRLLPCMLTR